jgi:hypothetical protein
MYHDGSNLYFHSAYEVSVVDTTAAGDTFMGYFIAGLSEGMAPDAILRRACVASALAVSVKGAAPSIPYEKDVCLAMGSIKTKDAGFVANEETILAKIEAYIDENIQSVSLASLSGELGYSSVYTGHIVKKATGKSFSDYLAYAHKLHLAGVEKDSALKQTLAYARSNKTNKSNQ